MLWIWLLQIFSCVFLHNSPAKKTGRRTKIKSGLYSHLDVVPRLFDKTIARIQKNAGDAGFPFWWLFGSLREPVLRGCLGFRESDELGHFIRQGEPVGVVDHVDLLAVQADQIVGVPRRGVFDQAGESA